MKHGSGLSRWRVWRIAGAVTVSVALAACGGDGDGAGSSAGNGSGGGTPPSSPSTPDTPQSPGTPETPTTPQAVTYLGVISFGDTIAVTLDAPAAGQVRIRFSDSAFGLAGAVIGNYARSGDVYTVSGLKADDAEPPPAFVTALLSSVTATFTVSGTTLTGEIAGLPKQLGNGKLTGQVTASSVTAPVSATDLAATYTFVRAQSTYYTSSGNLQVQYGYGGQMRVGADGAVRMCQTSAYSDACGMGLTGTLVLADQTSYPGAYTLTLGGKVWGRVFARRENGVTTLYFDHNQMDTGGNRIAGSGVFRQAQTLTMNQVAGQWVCRQPGVSYDAPTGIGLRVALDGSVQEETLTIDDAGLIVSARTNLSAAVTLNAANNLIGMMLPAAVPGVLSVNWISQEAASGLRTQVFMPIDAQTMAYYAEVNAKASDPVQWTYIAQGMCRKG